MDDIRKWLHSKKNYIEGVKLYLQHGRDPMLIRLFTEEKESEFKKKKLASALEALLSPGKKDSAVIIIPKGTVATIVAKAENGPPIENRWPDKRDDVLQSLWLTWKEKFGEMMNLQARLADIAKAGISDINGTILSKDPNKYQEAGRMALRILDLDDECDKLYFNRDYYEEHKMLPGQKGPIEISQDPALWFKKLHNHQRYVRSHRVDLEKDPSNVKKAKLLHDNEWAVEQYKKLLKMDVA